MLNLTAIKQATTVPTVINRPSKIPKPPACHASDTGGIETSTPANPPKAAKPITPTLKSPA